MNSGTSDSRGNPTLRELNRVTMAALVTSASAVLFAILPAEYGIDPTGIGSWLGLTELGKMKQAQDGVIEGSSTAQYSEIPSACADTQQYPAVLSIEIHPNEVRQIKALMDAGGVLTYNWKTDGPPLDYEFHGERTGLAPDGGDSHRKGTSAGESGTFQPEYSGIHGWTWKNNGATEVTVTATVRGAFHGIAARP